MTRYNDQSRNSKLLPLIRQLYEKYQQLKQVIYQKTPAEVLASYRVGTISAQLGLATNSDLLLITDYSEQIETIGHEAIS